MRIGLLGGTFNPIHLGHLLMAEAARDKARLDRVIFLPAGEPPHKNKPKTSARHRLAMVRQAVRGNSHLSVSDWEIRQGRIVYTYEAIAHFQKRWPAASLYFIVGSDSMRDVPLWRNSRQLMRHARFIVVERPERPWASLPASLRRQALHAPSQPVPFASHAIRQAVRQGRSIRYQVPASVERYIQAHRLYRRPE
jgi:nicotinate-nucleotide adenylyltransferase